MDNLDLSAFADLFGAVCRKCFGYPLKEPLTETESKLLSNHIFEQTGLTVGWKSLKNYSFFLLSDSPSKGENPSVATLDTLSRYVLEAPYTTEPERKKMDGHYPYWYRYKGAVAATGGHAGAVPKPDHGGERETRNGRRRIVRAGILFTVVGLSIVVLTLVFRGRAFVDYTDNFRTTRMDSLSAGGWSVKDVDTVFWNRRQEIPGGLSLFTLKGDNWPDPPQPSRIRNLLWRRLPCDCFTLEVHWKDFIPRQNWQQTGILLLEDTGFTGKSLRVSLAYNDYMGGGPLLRQIYVQAITSLGDVSSKPEEIAHVPLFTIDTLDRYPILARNLEHSALRIEKQGRRFRLLYSNGVSENASFKEMVSHEFDMTPRYIGLFALKGFVDSTADIPATITFFSLHCARCELPPNR